MVDKNKKTKLVGDFIRKKRESLGLSQRALGLLFDPPVTTQFISNVERGVTPLPPIHVPILTKALSTSEGEIMALLEQEYALKLNGRLGKSEAEHNGNHSNSSHSVRHEGTLTISNSDYEFMKDLYDAYRIADSKTKESFFAVCHNIFKLNRN